MASRPEKEAMALSGVANFLQAYLQAKKETKQQKRDDERFNATLAAKRLEDQQAERWKRTQFALDQEKAINQIAGMGREQFFTDPRTGQVTNQAPVMNPADIEAAQKRVRALLPGAQYGYTPNAPLLGLGAGPQQPVTNDATVVPSGAFPGLSTGAPAPAETLTVNPVPSAPETLRQFPRPGTGVKSTGKGGAGEGSGTDKSPFWDKMDQEFANTLSQWETTGRAEFASGVGSLEDTATKFLSGEVKGGWLGLVPGRALTRPELDQSIKAVEKVVFPQLRQTMGAQFTEKEGTRVINATIDPLQTGENNARRILALAEVMKEQAQAKEKLAEYVKQKGTLRGYPNPSIDLTGAEIRRRVNERVAPASTNPFANMSDADLAKREAELKAKMLGGK